MGEKAGKLTLVKNKDPDECRETLDRELRYAPRLLLIRLRSLGDSILSLPVLEALHRWHPDLQLDILVEAPFASVFSSHPAVHESLILRSETKNGGTGWTRPRAMIEVRRRHYPLVVNMHGGTTSLLFTLASGARTRVGQKSFRNSWAYNVEIPDSSIIWNRSNLHTIEHQLTLLKWLEVPQAELQCTLYVDRRARVHTTNRLHQNGLSSQQYFLIHPTATLFTKQWQETKFAQLADDLFRRYGFPTVFTSAREEAGVLESIKEYSSGPHRYWPDLELDELFALIEGCRLFVGNDSGPSHAASALKKPLVVVWGSSNYVAWRPWGKDSEVVRSDLPCMPCAGYTCEAFGDPKCVREIVADRVLSACERILDKTDQ